MAAIEWAASQPWSTGKVGTYGKSYDGVTGLLAEILQPKGLAAVVSQEPVYDMYRYLFADGIRFLNSLATPALYDAIAATPGSVADEPDYFIGSVNSTQRPGCEAANYGRPAGPESRLRVLEAARPDRQGGQRQDAALHDPGLPGEQHEARRHVGLLQRRGRAEARWFGMWDHVRGNDVNEEGRLLMGRKGFFDEVMRFYDRG